MKKRLISCLPAILIAGFVYFIVAAITFAFRHPWATDTERILHIFDALAFRKVPYDEMRPR